MVSDEDFEYRQARHERMLALMRMQGEINRQQSRVYYLWIIAAVLGVLAVVLGTL